MKPETPAGTAPTLQCPTCRTPLTWDTNNPFRPFCSSRCQNQDFIGWAREEHRISGETDYDDVLSEALD